MSKFNWLNTESRTFLSRGYLKKNERAEDRLWEIAKNAEAILGVVGFADKFYDYLGRGFYSLSTPVWTSFGRKRGLPVSCFGSYIPDDTAKIFSKNAEVAIMSKQGGGTSGYFGDVRCRGSVIGDNEGFTDGPVRFMESFDKTTEVVSQGSARRGSFAAYLPVEHPDILEFLTIREDHHEIQDMSFGVTISDKWMTEMLSGDKDKRKIWSRIIQRRYESGYPYIMFSDSVNDNLPEIYKEIGARVLASNLCSEICLPSTETESFVCVLASLNLLLWEEIEKTDAIETLVMFLDAVNEEFVRKTENMAHMKAPHNFAKRHRALGVGALGWHSLLQSKMIDFEGMDAKLLNMKIWRTIRKRADEATEKMAETHGPAPIYIGAKSKPRRNTTVLAVAPTTSSSFILGQVSPSIEPLNANIYVKKLAKGSFTYKNPYLCALLEQHGKNTDETWEDILIHGGSIQHVNFLTEHEKNVFKTFGEISQKEIIIQNAQRQKYIDQAISLNLLVPPEVKPIEVSKLLLEGYKMGIKTFYYQRSANPAQQLARSILTCKSCEA